MQQPGTLFDQLAADPVPFTPGRQRYLDAVAKWLQREEDELDYKPDCHTLDDPVVRALQEAVALVRQRRVAMIEHLYAEYMQWLGG